MNASVPRSRDELIAIRDSVSLVARLSDGLFRVGPFSLGIEGLVSWIPGLGEAYSSLAGAFIVVQGIRAGVPFNVLAGAVAILCVRTAGSAVPILGVAFADLFTAHRWAAAMVVKSIDERLGAKAAAEASKGFSPEPPFRGWKSRPA